MIKENHVYDLFEGSDKLTTKNNQTQSVPCRYLASGEGFVLINNDGNFEYFIRHNAICRGEKTVEWARKKIKDASPHCFIVDLFSLIDLSY